MVEQRTENPCVSGSIPELGIEKKIRYYGILAQLVEHLTFNQVVRGSNPRTLIFEKWRKILEIEIFRFFRFIYFIISRSYYE